MTNSRISGFYNMKIEERRLKLEDAAEAASDGLLPFTTGGLSPEAADHMIENVIGLYSLPLGIALNFQVNGGDVLVPMTYSSIFAAGFPTAGPCAPKITVGSSARTRASDAM